MLEDGACKDAEKEEDEEVRLDDGDIDFGCDVRYSRGSSLGSGDRRSSAGDFAAAVGSSATSSSYMDKDKDEDDAEGLEQAHVEGDGGRVAVLLGELVDGGAADRGLPEDLQGA